MVCSDVMFRSPVRRRGQAVAVVWVQSLCPDYNIRKGKLSNKKESKCGRCYLDMMIFNMAAPAGMPLAGCLCIFRRREYNRAQCLIHYRELPREANPAPPTDPGTAQAKGLRQHRGSGCPV